MPINSFTGVSPIVPFPMTDALSESNAWPVVGQCRAGSEFSSCRLRVPLCSFARVKSCRPDFPDARIASF